jgi:hypothetical protein
LDALRLLKIEIWLLCLIPDRLVIGPLGGIGSPAAVLAVMLFPFWLVCSLSPALRPARVCVPVRLVLAAWVCVNLISYAVMNLHVIPGDELGNSDRFLISTVGFCGVALVAAEGLRNKEEVLSALRTLVAAIGAVAFIGIVQFRPGIDLTTYLAKLPGLTARGDLAAYQDRAGFSRPASTTLHPIEFGVVLGCGLAFALHFLFYDTHRPRWRRVLPFGLIALGIPISISRSAILVAICVLGYFAAGATRHQRRLLLTGSLAFVIFVFGAVPGMLGTIKDYVFAGQSDSSITHRTADYAYAAPFLRNAPWIGRGPATFIPEEFSHILDNQYLHSLIEIGIIGTLVLAAVYVTPVFLGRGARYRCTDEAERNLGQMFAGAGLGAAVAAATFDALSFPTFTALVSIMVGLSGAWWYECKHGRRPDGEGGEALGEGPTEDVSIEALKALWCPDGSRPVPVQVPVTAKVADRLVESD